MPWLGTPPLVQFFLTWKKAYDSTWRYNICSNYALLAFVAISRSSFLVIHLMCDFVPLFLTPFDNMKVLLRVVFWALLFSQFPERSSFWYLFSPLYCWSCSLSLSSRGDDFPPTTTATCNWCRVVPGIWLQVLYNWNLWYDFYREAGRSSSSVVALW